MSVLEKYKFVNVVEFVNGIHAFSSNVYEFDNVYEFVPFQN